jgi:hypothetical protein
LYTFSLYRHKYKAKLFLIVILSEPYFAIRTIKSFYVENLNSTTIFITRKEYVAGIVGGKRREVRRRGRENSS